MNDITKQLSSEYIKLYAEEAARFIEQLDDAQTLDIVSMLSQDQCAKLISFTNANLALIWLKNMPVAKAAGTLSLLENDYSALLIRRLPGELKNEIIATLPKKKQHTLTKALNYAERSIGAFADPLVLTISDESSVSDALNHIKESIEYQHEQLYVVNRSQKLVGYVSLKEFITAKPQHTIRDIMLKPPLVLTASANRSKYTEKILNSNSNELPVVDKNNLLIGILRKEVIKQYEDIANQPQQENPSSLVMSFAELFWQMLSGLFPDTKESIPPNKRVKTPQSR